MTGLGVQSVDRIRLSWLGCSIVSVCSIVIGVLALLQGEPNSGWFSLVFATVVGAMGLFIHRFGGPVRVIGHLLVGLLVVFLCVSGLLFGGYAGGAPLVVPAVAAIAFFLIGGRGALAWTLLLIGVNTLLMVYVDRLPPTLLINPDNGRLNHAISSATALAVLAVAYGFAAQEERRRVEAQRARATAEAAQRVAEMAQTQAEAASRAKSAFFAAMSHELRTPLNAVVGAAQLLDGCEPSERELLVSTIQQAGVSLAGQLEDVLDFSRIEVGELSLNPAPMEPGLLLRQVRSVFSTQAERKGLRLFIELPAESSGMVLLDQDRARQVLLNLVGNALKFTVEGHVRVSLRSVPGPALRFTVEDTGPGISPSAQERIFQPFRQVEEGLQRSYGGFGLGLAISRGIAQAMGGSLGVESAESGGCRFVFEVAAPPVQGGAAAQNQPAGETQGLKVLLVEDNPTNRMIAQAMLRRMGCTVRVAANGQLGVDAVRARRPDVVLMDLQMPVMDGLTATRLIRGFEPELPIVVLSANAFAQDRAAATEAGANDFLCKPVLQEELSETLGRWGPPQAALRWSDPALSLSRELS